MLEKNVKNRQQAEIICLEDLVPENHLLRKIDRAVDFDRKLKEHIHKSSAVFLSFIKLFLKMSKPEIQYT